MPVGLLDLLLPQGQVGHEGYIKLALNHGASSSNLAARDHRAHGVLLIPALRKGVNLYL